MSDENNAHNIYNTLPVSNFVYNQALLAFISRRLWYSFRYLTLAFCSRLFCHTIHNSLQFGITDGIMESRTHGSTDLWKLRFATPRLRDNESTRQRSGGSRNYGFTESRNYGLTELRKLNFALLRQTTRQRVNETTSSAAATCSLVVLWTSSLRSNSEAQAKQKKLLPFACICQEIFRTLHSGCVYITICI